MTDVFEPYEAVVTPSGSCAAMIRERFAHLFEHEATERARAVALASRTYEFAEFLSVVARVDLRAMGVRWEGTVVAHSACHLRGLGLTGVAEGLLRQIDGLTLVDLPHAEQCCGFGGTFAVKYPQISGGMVAEKVESIRSSGCGTLVCSEAGCGLNLAGALRRAGERTRMISLAEILAEGLGLLEPGEAPR